MQAEPTYDAAIIGGGLAGLAAALLLRGLGHSVLLAEKEQFPYHKVCGEYLSRESWDFLERLGLPLSDMRLPLIDTLVLTAPAGKAFTTKLPLGGFGLSRYRLESQLAGLARESGVDLREETRVESVTRGGGYTLELQDREKGKQTVHAKLVAAAYGKRSNLDLRWQRSFLSATDKRLDNYIAVKYHLRRTGPEHVISLHNFEDGYCGLSKVEDDTWCCCYLTRASALRRSGNSIPQLEREVLGRNPHLKKVFSESEFLPSFPVTISQVGFGKKSQVENGMLMLGDAAGMITPLCGNGMSIALHTAAIAAPLMHRFLEGGLTQEGMEAEYRKQWDRFFGSRLATGRLLQRFFGSTRLSNGFVGLFATFPFLAAPVVRMTHGKPF